MNFQRADTEDIPQLVDMRVAYIKCDQGEVTESDLAAMQTKLPEYFQKHLNKDLIAFIAKDNGRIAATAFLLVVEKPSNPHFINGKVGEVLNVYTSDEYRHKGLATALMNDLIAYASENNLDHVDLSATEDGYPLYKKLGFKDSASSYMEMRYQF